VSVRPTVAIIGAGPAGMSAALWVKQLGMHPVIFEKEPQAGGMQCFNFLLNEWVLGQQEKTGVQIGESYYQHILQENVECHFNSQVNSIQCLDDGVILQVEKDDSELTVSCRALILAVGTRFLGAEILPDVGKGILEGSEQHPKDFIIEGPYAFENIKSLAGKRIAIVGAGDNAFENASLLLEHDCEVIMLARSQASAQKKFIDAVLSNPLFTLYESATINAVDVSSASVLLNFSTKEMQRVTVDRLHVLAGYQSNASHLLPLISQHLECDDDGFVVVDDSGRTNINNIYSAGDVCDPIFPSVVSAVASGALAAKTISLDLL
jgi:thioredoxin reductase (NADPH)